MQPFGRTMQVFTFEQERYWHRSALSSSMIAARVATVPMPDVSLRRFLCSGLVTNLATLFMSSSSVASVYGLGGVVFLENKSTDSATPGIWSGIAGSNLS